MRVVHVVSEVYPFSKTGGLAEVAHALPGALARLGVETTVLSPYYRETHEWCDEHGVPCRQLTFPGAVEIGNARHPLAFRVYEHDGRRWVFADAPAFYDRERLYVDATGRDYADSVARFSFLCRAAIEYGLRSGEPPDLFHVHDWQASLVPVYLKTIYGGHGAGIGAGSVLTIHNIGYQGLFPAEDIRAAGLDWSVFHPGALEFYGKLNLLKGGIVFADALTTVSPSYAREIQETSLGCGLEGVLRVHAHKLTGILNGIDVDRWNPAADPYLPARYSAEDLSGKAICKRELQRRMRLPEDDRAFLLGSVGRLTEQKGFSVLARAFPLLSHLRTQLVILGTGEALLEKRARELAESWPKRVACVIDFDESLAHLIEAGADAFVMPSAYEPCGLNQMYSQRYGTVPIVHATGGLKDTVVDATESTPASGEASGFSFAPLTVAGLADAIRRAADMYFTASSEWRRLVMTIMKLDHSWSASARQYYQLYEKILQTRGRDGRDG